MCIIQMGSRTVQSAYRQWPVNVHVGWPLSKGILQQNPETNFGKKSRMKSRRKTKIAWEGKSRRDSAK
jgi:hypothetical protein